MTNNHRSATVSPSSENSPSQDMQSEEGSYPHPGGGGFNQYSSQDSLPDSPYSSQSLDSQPAPGQGKQRFLFWIMHPNISSWLRYPDEKFRILTNTRSR